MKNLNKYFLSIIFISLVTFLSANENIYEYKIRFKIKNVISLDGIKELTIKGNDSYHIIFTGKNRMLNAELNQEAEFKYLNSNVFPKYFSAIAEHSICQPGKPSPQGEAHLII